MNKEQLEKELVDYLIQLVPVPWTKIGFWAASSNGSGTFFFGVREKETDIVVNYDTFYKRYKDIGHSFSQMDISIPLFKTVQKMYKQDSMEMQDKAWCEFVLTIEHNCKYNFKYFYLESEKHNYLSREQFLKKYLDSDYLFVNSQYPSREYVRADKILNSITDDILN